LRQPRIRFEGVGEVRAEGEGEAERSDLE